MINICIIHYNTPLLTECLIKSINKFTPNSKIYLFDNSDADPFIYRQNNIVYLDNTKGQIINFDKWLEKYPNRNLSGGKLNKWGSAKHCISVERCMDIINDDFILMDSDILLMADVSSIIDKKCYISGGVGRQFNNRNRLNPFLCYINTPLLKQSGLHYFDENHMHGLHYTSEGDGYDTGAWIYEKCHNNMKHINLLNYIIHYGGASWIDSNNTRRNKLSNTLGKRNSFDSPEKWLNDHKILWQVPERIIVTMTTWRGRITNVPAVLSTILKQSKMPDKIVINLSREEFGDYKNLPVEFKDFVEKNKIEINWIEGKNTKQWKKTIPTMLRYPNDCVICIDDDRLYPPNFISALWETHLKYPNNPITHNKTYKFKGKYLQHAGHGTLDKLEYYGGFKNIDFEHLYDFASSDTFFTLIATNNGHPMFPVNGNVDIKMFNEINPLRKSQKTCDIGTHIKMYEYLTDSKIINLGTNIITNVDKDSIPINRGMYPSAHINDSNEIKDMLNVMSDGMGVNELKKPKAKIFTPVSRKRAPLSIVKKFLY